MAKFLTTTHLNSALSDLIEQADNFLILISPFIKLHPGIKSLLQDRIDDYKLELVIVFGKNESNKSKSISEEDLEFLKSFPNVAIRYEKRLHAKYYANDFSSILTSMNLYDYSQNNNIEFGILYETKLFGKSIDDEAIDYFTKVIDQSELLFQKEPEFDNGKFLGVGKKYTGSVVSKDNLNKAMKESSKNSFKPRKDGYCIRTKAKIPLNQKRPFSDEAFKSWNKFKKEDYPEKYCHFTGELSSGETSYARPFLKKNYKKAMELIKS